MENHNTDTHRYQSHIHNEQTSDEKKHVTDNKATI